jgi:hypothetical protein
VEPRNGLRTKERRREETRFIKIDKEERKHCNKEYR